MSVTLHVREEELPSFLACIGIGTLHAILQGAPPTEAGIWSLSRLVVSASPTMQSLIPAPVLAVYEGADELSAIQSILPEHYKDEVLQMIGNLHEFLRQTNGPWSATMQLDKS
jgi:hypothetical protein